MTRLRVLYDGWELSYHPGGAGALHLLALLAALPPEVEPVVALPGPSSAAPRQVQQISRAAQNTPWQRLAWEQRALPALARQAEAALLHVFSGGPLAPGLPVTVSPAETVNLPSGGGLAGRLRAALAAGGAVGWAALLWPADLPAPPGSNVKILPPLAHPAFSRPASAHPGLTEPYLLFPGSNDERLFTQAILGWAWCAAAVGEMTPLVLADRAPTPMDPRSEMDAVVRSVVAQTAGEWAALYRNARAVLCLGRVAPWGGPLLHALAAGRAIIALEDRLTAARVGPAGYLVPRFNSSLLGAALATLAVEEDLAERLGAAAGERARGWGSEAFGARLLEVYREVL